WIRPDFGCSLCCFGCWRSHASKNCLLGETDHFILGVIRNLCALGGAASGQQTAADRPTPQKPTHGFTSSVGSLSFRAVIVDVATGAGHVGWHKVSAALREEEPMLRTFAVASLAIAMSVGLAQAKGHRQRTPLCAVGQQATATCACGVALSGQLVLCQ